MANWSWRIVFAVLAIGCADSLVPIDYTSLQLAIVSGDAQVDTVTRLLSDPLVVETLDDNGQSQSGVLVNFIVLDDGCGSLFVPSVLSNINGEAWNMWTLGIVAGSCVVEVRAINDTGQPVTYTTFTATALSDKLASWVWQSQAVTRQIGDTTSIDALLRSASDKWGNSIPVDVVHDTHVLKWSFRNNLNGGRACAGGTNENPVGSGWDIPIPGLLGYPVGHTPVEDTVLYWVAARISWKDSILGGSGMIATLKQYIDHTRCGW